MQSMSRVQVGQDLACLPGTIMGQGRVHLAPLGQEVAQVRIRNLKDQGNRLIVTVALMHCDAARALLRKHERVHGLRNAPVPQPEIISDYRAHSASSSGSMIFNAHFMPVWRWVAK